MPGNIIVINSAIEYYVGDSKMPQLLKFLNDNGFPENEAAEKLVKAQKEGKV